MDDFWVKSAHFQPPGEILDYSWFFNMKIQFDSVDFESVVIKIITHC